MPSLEVLLIRMYLKEINEYSCKGFHVNVFSVELFTSRKIFRQTQCLIVKAYLKGCGTNMPCALMQKLNSCFGKRDRQ